MIIFRITIKKIGKGQTVAAYWVVVQDTKNISIKLDNKTSMDIIIITLMIWWWVWLNSKKRIEIFLTWMAFTVINIKRKMILASTEKVHSWICSMIAYKITVWMQKWSNNHLLHWMIKTHILLMVFKEIKKIFIGIPENSLTLIIWIIQNLL